MSQRAQTKKPRLQANGKTRAKNNGRHQSSGTSFSAQQIQQVKSNQLQHVNGSKEMQDLLRAGVIQADLLIGAQDTPAEREADQIAQLVVNTNSNDHISTIEAGSLHSGNSKNHAKHSGKTSSRKPVIRRKVGGSRSSAQAAGTSSVNKVLSSGGKPLPAPERKFFEPRFGRDFSHVRIHTDEPAANSAAELNAKAYTLNNHIVLGKDQYRPGTKDGRTLLAHELTHTIQQGSEKDLSTIQRSPDRRGEEKTGALQSLRKALSLKSIKDVSQSVVVRIGQAIIDSKAAQKILSSAEEHGLVKRTGGEGGALRYSINIESPIARRVGIGLEHKSLSVTVSSDGAIHSEVKKGGASGKLQRETIQRKVIPMSPVLVTPLMLGLLALALLITLGIIFWPVIKEFWDKIEFRIPEGKTTDEPGESPGGTEGKDQKKPSRKNKPGPKGTPGPNLGPKPFIPPMEVRKPGECECCSSDIRFFMNKEDEFENANRLGHKWRVKFYMNYTSSHGSEKKISPPRKCSFEIVRRPIKDRPGIPGLPPREALTEYSDSFKNEKLNYGEYIADYTQLNAEPVCSKPFQPEARFENSIRKRGPMGDGLKARTDIRHYRWEFKVWSANRLATKFCKIKGVTFAVEQILHVRDGKKVEHEMLPDKKARKFMY